MASFLRVYADRFPDKDGKARLLDVGSQAFEGQPTHKSLINPRQIAYSGLDLEPGLNVDIVALHKFVWPEIADESFDICISGQTFEHNPFFWVTMAEIARVLVPGGYACIIAPGGGKVHRYPLDCWRFYPDSWGALCSLCGLEPVEVYFEPDDMAMVVVDGGLRDSMVIARKPLEPNEGAATRRRMLIEPFSDGYGSFEPVMHREGPAIADYRKTAAKGLGWRSKLAAAVKATVLPIYDPSDPELGSNS
ncbi:MAG: methyltransferase domain-containing protein [Sphingomonas sp.]